MALPTAQLGQLPTMNMPYSVPTYEVGPSIWEKALAAFLVNAGGAAATRGVQNVMSQDFANEFGETPAKGFGKLVKGPRVGEEDAIRRRTQAGQDRAQMRGIAAEANRDKFNAVQQLRRQETDINTAIERERMAYDRQDAENASRVGLADKQLAAEIRARALQEEIAALRQAQDPARLAQAEADRARARLSNAEAGIYERFNKGGTQAQPTQASAPQVSPEVAEFVKSQAGESLPDMSNYVPGLSEYIARVTGSSESAPASAPTQPAPGPQNPAYVPSGAMAGPMSMYDPTLDPILNQIAELMRRPPGVNR